MQELFTFTPFASSGDGFNLSATVIDGEPWFVAADVCMVLELGNPSQALKRLDDDEKSNTLISNEGSAGNPNVSIVNEPGLYTLVLGSRNSDYTNSSLNASSAW